MIADQVFKGMGKIPPHFWILAALGVGYYILKKGGVAGAVAGVTAGAVSTAGDVVSGVATGAVVGIGQTFGIPATEQAKCQAAMKAGDNWNASLYCDAGTFMEWQAAGVKAKLKDILSFF